MEGPVHAARKVARAGRYERLASRKHGLHPAGVPTRPSATGPGLTTLVFPVPDLRPPRLWRVLISLVVGALAGGTILPAPTSGATQAGVAPVTSTPPSGCKPTEKPFSIRRHAGADWLVRPDGTRFFSLGVCCVDQGTAREKYDPEKPGYAAWQ